MIAIVDYGVGNLFSLSASFAYIGERCMVTGDEDVIRRAEKLVLPGVGAFGDAAELLRSRGLGDIVRAEAKKGKPLLGICLGMQLLLDKSYEFGEHKGLGLVPGEVRSIAEAVPEDYKIPHIGWNSLVFPKDRPKSAIYKNTDEGARVYFVHSYQGANCAEHTSALTEYGAMLTASVEKDNVYGLQFHPEKSGDVGLDILRAFCAI